MSEASVQTQAPETVTVGKKAKAKATTGNFLLDTATEVETLTKVKALSMADSLVENIDANYFKLGGVLKLIADNSWFEEFPDFNTFVAQKYGFQGRKSAYLMQIYTDLVSKQIPWDTVKHLGWTKLKELSTILTPENVEEWMVKVEGLTTLDIIALVKAQGAAPGETSAKTSDDVVKMTFKLKGDQAEIVQAALAKCKGEAGTDYDNVALEMICAGYVAGTVGGSTPAATPAATAPDLKSVFADIGWEKVLEAFGEVFPDVDLEVTAATA
jgi:hypothetical protein